MYTYDKRTVDSTGAFLVGELERLDKTLNLPLVQVTWNRDIDLREDVTMGDETSSFTVTSFSAPGGVNPTGKNWIGKDSTALAGIQLDTGKFPFPLHLWGMELGWSLPELESAQQLGRPIDTQKYDGMQLKYNMDVDEMVYIGDTDVNAYGLVNNPAIQVGNSTLNWETAAPEQILDDVNDLLADTWKRSGYAVVPDQLRLPPQKLGRLTRPVTSAGSESLLTYISEKCLTFVETGRALEIKSLKWLNKRGVGGKDRVLAYTRDKKYVRFPLVPMQKTPLEHRGIYQLVAYFCKLGHMEFVYPETVGYMDGE